MKLDTSLDIAGATEIHGFELTLWHLMMKDSGYGVTGPDAITHDISTRLAEGNPWAIEWDTPVTLHYTNQEQL